MQQYTAIRLYGGYLVPDAPEYCLTDAIHVARIKANADREPYGVRPIDERGTIYEARFVVRPHEGSK